MAKGFIVAWVLWGVSYFYYPTIYQLFCIIMQWFSYLNKRRVLQQEYSQPPILPSPHFQWVLPIWYTNSWLSSPRWPLTQKTCWGCDWFTKPRQHTFNVFLQSVTSSNRVILISPQVRETVKEGRQGVRLLRISDWFLPKSWRAKVQNEVDIAV